MNENEPENILGQSEERFRQFMKHLPGLAQLKDENHRIIYLNETFERAFNIKCDEWLGKTVEEIFPAETARGLRENDQWVLDNNRTLEVLENVQQKDGIHEYLSYKFPLKRPGKPTIVGAVSIDITRTKQMEAQLSHKARQLDEVNRSLRKMANEDYMTGVMNRRGLDEYIRNLPTLSSHGGKISFACLIDIDNFKDVNHTFGYVMGDTAIKKIAGKIMQWKRPEDAVGRIGGDEFMVIFREASEEDVLKMAEQIRMEIGGLVIGLSSGRRIQLSASAGIVGIGGSKTSLEELIERSYALMNRSKKVGKNKVTFNDDDGGIINSSGDTIMNMLREDDHKRVIAYNQGIYRLSDRSQVGSEMLSRLDVLQHGSPKEFFHLAMESKILTFVDRLCLRSCLEASGYQDSSQEVHVNIFPSTLIEIPTDKLISEIRQLVGDREICVEVSEQQILGDPTQLVQPVKRLRESGIKVAIDDVGFGSSCLESLLLLDPDVIKIDMSCISGVSKDKAKMFRLRKLYQIIKACGATAVAEGIETEADLKIITDIGVEFGQGYLFHKPSPVLAEGGV